MEKKVTEVQQDKRSDHIVHLRVGREWKQKFLRLVNDHPTPATMTSLFIELVNKQYVKSYGKEEE